MQQALAKVENLEVQPGSVADLIWVEGEDGWKVGGVKLGTSVFSVGLFRLPDFEYGRLRLYAPFVDTGVEVKCSSVVICTGTFLGGEYVQPQHVIFSCYGSEGSSLSQDPSRSRVVSSRPDQRATIRRKPVSVSPEA
jgi:tRNA U34 5-carboxymethylaminomethyl modifying enzyme MnmG/GidA